MTDSVHLGTSPRATTSRTGHSAGWFDGLFDDAALFPPRQASPVEAVEGHLSWRRSVYHRMVGPFVCSDSQVQEVRAALPTEHEIQIALTVPHGMASLATALDLARSESLTVTQLEVPVGSTSDLSRAATVLVEEVARGVSVYVEIPIDVVDDSACSTLRAGGLRVKLRTGGVSADKFPSVQQLASTLARLVRHELPFKLTAGLHGAVRHRDPKTGFEHHGFLNVLLATSAAIRNSDESGVATILGLESGADAAATLQSLPDEMVSDVRALFTSFGTCSIDEPISDLQALGLLVQEM